MADYLYFKVSFQCNSEEIESNKTDIYIQDTESSDERVKWHNLFYLLYERASKISDVKGFCRYMGISEYDPNLPDDDRDIYFLEDKPMGVIGMCSTDYERENN